MTNIILKDAKSFLDGRDISGILNQIALNLSRDMKDSAVFGDSTERNTPGIKNFGVNQSGYWDVNADGDIIANIESFTATMLASFAAEGGTLGDVAFIARAHVENYTPGASHGELFGFSFDLVPEGTDVLRGTIMENGAFTVTGNGTGRQFTGGVGATQKLVGQLHVVSASGTTPTLDVIVQSDADSGFGTPVTRLTFAQATAATVERQEVNGAITDEWLRANLTIGGTGSPSFTIFLVLAIVEQ